MALLEAFSLCETAVLPKVNLGMEVNLCRGKQQRL